MVLFKYSVFCVFVIFISCKSDKKDFDLTFYKWNIHGDYYLKLNSSDTVYLIVENPINNQTGFAILNQNEKEKLNSYLTELAFPDKEEFSNNVNDGLSYVFVYKDQNRKHKLFIHAKAGPKEFWRFGEFLEQIQTRKKFSPVSKKFDLKEVRDLVLIPPPEPFK